MVQSMNWHKTSETSMRCAPWTVAKVSIKGHTVYELWHDNQPSVTGRYDSFAAARADAEKENA